MNYSNQAGEGFVLPTADFYYPELRESNRSDYNQFMPQAGEMSPLQNQPHYQPHEPNRPQARHYNPTSASAYRALSRQRKLAREMNARNGLYSPMETTGQVNRSVVDVYNNGCPMQFNDNAMGHDYSMGSQNSFGL